MRPRSPYSGVMTHLCLLIAPATCNWVCFHLITCISNLIVIVTFEF